MRIIETIVAQHAEDAAFQWLLRDHAVRAPHYSLSDLAGLDNRVEAHLDALRIAGKQGWPFCVDGLRHEETGEVFAAALIAFGSGIAERIQQVCAVVEAVPETLRGLVSALGWLPRDRFRAPIAGFLASRDPLWRRAAIAAYAIHRVDPGAHLVQAIDDPEPGPRARALRAAGELGRVDLLPALLARLGSEDEICRFWAAWSAALVGNRDRALAVLSKVALSNSALAELAMVTLIRAARPGDAKAWLGFLAKREEGRRGVIVGCGASGDPAYVPWLIGQMGRAAELARVAGESFSLITGVNIAHEDLEGERPEGFEPGPTENPEDENLVMDADEDLPWPDPKLIEAWWSVNGQALKPGARYLVGSPIQDVHCRELLRKGFQRERSVAALELALMQPPACLFETRAPGFRQQSISGLRNRGQA